MANILDKTDLTGHVDLNEGKQNWISQINAGGTTYDIATHHSIVFKDGNDDSVGTTWNGLSDIEIVIPSITDIVQTPIEFAGTVGEDGNITWNEGHSKAEVGNLVYITKDCEFDGKACEAGDMAIYTGSGEDQGWKVVSGENQVSIVNENKEGNVTLVEIGAAKEVLDIEGKKLSLTLDYNDLNGHVNVTKSGNSKAPVTFGNMTVGSAYVKLSQSSADVKTIGQNVSIQEAKSLANGNVTLTGTNEIVTDVTFGEFNAGSLPHIVMNADDRTFNVTGGSLTQTSTEHFVTSVSLADVTFGSSSSAESGSFALVGGIAPGTGQAFVTGIDGKGEFTVAGCIQPTDGADATYIKGITGNYVTGLNAGSFTLVSGDSLATGFGAENDKSGDVVSNVSVSTSSEDVLNSATVENHVLSFGKTSVLNSASSVTKFKSLQKTGFSYVPSTVVSQSFETGTFTKSSDVKYTLNTANETTYTTTSAYYKITTPKLEVHKGGYELSNTGMVANVAANTFAVNVDGGVLPSLTSSSVVRSANITGSVSTALSFEPKDIIGLTSNTISLPGAYTLVAGSEGDGVEVGAAGNLSSNVATIDLSNYVIGVEISETINNA